MLFEQALQRKPSLFDRSVDIQLSRLRRKMGDGCPIKTIRGMRYMLIEPVRETNMNKTFDSLALRISLILLVSLGLFHIASLYLHQTALTLVADDDARDSQLAERLVSIKQAITEQPAALRRNRAWSFNCSVRHSLECR